MVVERESEREGGGGEREIALEFDYRIHYMKFT